MLENRPFPAHTAWMGTGPSIILAGALIAASILLTNHWELTNSPMGIEGVGRLNRWTGTIEVCAIDVATARTKVRGNDVRGVQLTCDQ